MSGKRARSPQGRDKAEATTEAEFHQAAALHRQGRFVEAEKALRKLLRRDPAHVDAIHLLGVIALQAGQPQHAVDILAQAIELDPTVAIAHCNLGIALRQLKRFDEALACHELAVTLRPDYADAYYNGGNVFGDLKRHEEAVASYDSTIALRPDHARAHNNRGNALAELKRLDEALAGYDRAIALQPGYVDAHLNRGNVLRDLKRPDDALASYDQVIALRPDHADAHHHRGVALGQLNRFEDALASYDRALALKPDFASAHSNRSNALSELNRCDEALAGFAEAIALKPDYAEAIMNRSLCLLKMGRFEQGWRDYESRKALAEQPVAARKFSQPLWLGDDDIAGKRLFLWWEQGFGDTLQFCRYAKLAETRGARIIMSVQEPLREVLAQFGQNIALIGSDETPDDFDFHCPLLSLPLAFRTTLETIPAEPRYLAADSERIAAWSSRLPPKTKPRIGLAWSGSATHRNDRNRSLTLQQLLPWLGAEFDWFSLQKDVREEDAALLRASGPITDLSDGFSNFTDTAALIELMDLVISVDTSVAHLAGAMGKPVWILLPFNPDFRWLLDRTDSPWYPSAKLFRQPAVGDWAGVLADIQRELPSVFG